MNRETISDKQGIVLVVMFLCGSTLVLGTAKEAGKDIWISIILGFVVGLMFTLVFSKILVSFPGRDLFDISEILFGKYVGKVVSFTYVLYSIYLGALVLRNFGEFIITVALPETPMIVPMIIFIILCILCLKGGIEVLARCGEFFIVVFIGLILFIAILTVDEWNFKNLTPVLFKGIKPVLKGGLLAFSFPFGEVAVFAMILTFAKRTGSIYKIYILGMILGGGLILYISTRNIMVLGEQSMQSLYFPSYSAVSRINVADFLQRMEVTVSIVFMLGGFIKICICFLVATRGIAKIFKFSDYRLFVTPVGLIILNLSYIIYGSTMEIMEGTEANMYYKIIFQAIFPIIILLTTVIKKRFGVVKGS